MVSHLVRSVAIIFIVAIPYWIVVFSWEIVAIGQLNPDAIPMTPSQRAHMLQMWTVLKFPVLTLANVDSIQPTLRDWGIDPEGWVLFGLNGLLWGFAAMVLIEILAIYTKRLRSSLRRRRRPTETAQTSGPS